MQHQLWICVDELDKSEKKALITAGVLLCGFLFELKACGLFPNECETLYEDKKAHWLQLLQLQTAHPNVISENDRQMIQN